ncbi:hypothetical protein AbraIFM66951_004533 [Aspergillus brasiliensis]|uniref:Uncharacterized protein n=1 Tax=Aspergillus brasiliensis TaxID=319629 RepID=A0A9W5Z215_9EURO|nr:hypothetical protein AbraCBS73388_003715 [Aspergillus brasiliensis]GKZ50841.1 hypothetical protein AbraIFM66951_004533 [Aspergillus brasiliensis]
MLSTIDYQALRDFSGLPAIRKICVSKGTGFRVAKLPTLADDVLQQLQALPEGTQIFRKDLVKPTEKPSTTTTTAAAMTYLHALSHEVFKNISHALELPWENYLGEMHEFLVPSQDQLRILNPKEPIPIRWSTLTIIINLGSPSTATVLFGSALRVFSEETIASLNESTIDPNLLLLPDGSSVAAGRNWVVYYVRPNEDVFYTRAAGALMTPLSSEEHATRKRVREIDISV